MPGMFWMTIKNTWITIVDKVQISPVRNPKKSSPIIRTKPNFISKLGRRSDNPEPGINWLQCGLNLQQM